MADITYPGFFPFTGTDALNGSNFYDLFFDPAAPTASLSVINGNLGAANFATSFELEDIHTQPGSIVNAFAASGNANLDWRAGLFGGVTFNAGTGEANQISLLTDNARYYIPGANRTFYLPVDSHVLVMWTVYWNAQIVDSNRLSRVYFHVDGVVQQETGRNIAHTADSTTEIDNFAVNNGYLKARAYSGHHITTFGAPMTEGWHTVGLGIIAEPQALVTRTHACDIVVMTFKA